MLPSHTNTHIYTQFFLTQGHSYMHIGMDVGGFVHTKRVLLDCTEEASCGCMYTISMHVHTPSFGDSRSGALGLPQNSLCNLGGGMGKQLPFCSLSLLHFLYFQFGVCEY